MANEDKRMTRVRYGYRREGDTRDWWPACEWRHGCGCFRVWFRDKLTRTTIHTGIHPSPTNWLII